MVAISCPAAIVERHHIPRVIAGRDILAIVVTAKTRRIIVGGRDSRICRQRMCDTAIVGPDKTSHIIESGDISRSYGVGYRTGVLADKTSYCVIARSGDIGGRVTVRYGSAIFSAKGAGTD